MIPGLVGLLKASPPRSGPRTPSATSGRAIRTPESQGRDGGASGAAAGYRLVTQATSKPKNVLFWLRGILVLSIRSGFETAAKF